MNQLKNCSLLICKESNFTQELAQEKVSLFHNKQFKEQNRMNTIERVSIPEKEIFSFKLNSFREYKDSDKGKCLVRQKKIYLRQVSKLQNCRSNQKVSLKMPLNQLSKKQSIKMHFSPPPFTTQIRACQKQFQQSYPSQLYFNNNPSLGRQTASELDKRMVFNQQEKDSKTYLNSTQNSSMIKEHLNLKNKHNSTHNKFQPLNQRSKNQSLSLSFLLNNSFHAQKIDKMQQSPGNERKEQPIKYFQNVRTLKTIISHSAQNSVLDFADRTEDQEQSSYDQASVQTFKNIAKKQKRKTAFFGLIGNNKTEKSLALCFRQKPIEQQKHNHNSQQQYSEKGSSGQQLKAIQVRNNIPFKKNKKVDFQINQQSGGPSFNSFNQYTPTPLKQVSNQVSLQQSIKNMVIYDQNTENTPRLKYGNTINSIGGESMYSQNSYIDIKFMQSLQSRRIIKKLT